MINIKQILEKKMAETKAKVKKESPKARIQKGHLPEGLSDCRLKQDFELVRRYKEAGEDSILPNGDVVKKGDVIGFTIDGRFLGFEKNDFKRLYNSK